MTYPCPVEAKILRLTSFNDTVEVIPQKGMTMLPVDKLNELISQHPEHADILREAFFAGTNVGTLYSFLTPEIIREEADKSDLLHDHNYRNVTELDDDTINDAILRSDLTVNLDDDQLCESISREVTRAADKVIRLLAHEHC